MAATTRLTSRAHSAGALRTPCTSDGGRGEQGRSHAAERGRSGALAHRRGSHALRSSSRCDTRSEVCRTTSPGESRFPSIDGGSCTRRSGSLHSMRMKFVSRRTASKRCELIIRPRQRLPCLLSRKQWGIDPEETIRLKGALELPPQGYDRKELLQLAMDHRPDLAFQRANEALAHAELRSDRAKGKPDASLFGGYERPDFGFRNEPSMQREILHRFARLSTTLFLASISTCRCSIVIKVRSWRTRRPSRRHAVRLQTVDLNLRHEVAQNLIGSTEHRRGLRPTEAVCATRPLTIWMSSARLTVTAARRCWMSSRNSAVTSISKLGTQISCWSVCGPHCSRTGNWY